MKSYLSLSKLAVAAFILLFCAGCSGSGRYGVEEEQKKPEDSKETLRFNPLDLPQDTRIIPESQPRQGIIQSSQSVAVDTVDATVDSTVKVVIPPKVKIDSLSNQAFRIQIHATELFGDAKREARIAEEIFDQPVYLDYEVPYYKVRVGGFADRDSAEKYLEKTKAVGYRNAWVVAVKVNVKESRPLYEDLPVPQFNTPVEEKDE